MFDLSSLPTPTAGFGHCGRCTYLGNDNAALCYACARQTMQQLLPLEERCEVCDHPLAPNRKCWNGPCNMAPHNRGFEWNYAVAMRSGVIKDAIHRYKYDGIIGWSVIFSRILVGFLDAHALTFSEFDAIIASPSFVGGGGRTWDHTRTVLERAAELSDAWPFCIADPPMIRRTGEVASMVSIGEYQARREFAESDLRRVLEVPDARAVTGRQILVYDDVFTDGLTLREVALKLRAAGATRVCGVTLCRQAYRG